MVFSKAFQKTLSHHIRLTHNSRASLSQHRLFHQLQGTKRKFIHFLPERVKLTSWPSCDVSRVQPSDDTFDSF